MDKETMINIIVALNELKDDSTVPRNIKAKIETMISLLQDDTEESIKVSRVMHEIEEITEDSNLQPYTRTQIFNVVSLLEMI
ncbi:UPF0147 family protein [Candidatus Woesearchaeota archaeon]|nr:UPF0147 family protein [Candidatus Woesearchaeota archaeon]